MEYSLYNIIFFILSSLLVGYLFAHTGLMLYSLKSLNQSISSEVISFMGNVIGGIIGGIVAYLVASIQIQKTFELERKKSEKSNAAILRLLLIELETNKRIIENSKLPYLAGNNSFLVFIDSKQWESSSTSIGLEVEKETLISVMSVHNKFRLMKTDSEKLNEHQYDQLIGAIKESINKINNELEKLNK